MRRMILVVGIAALVLGAVPAGAQSDLDVFLPAESIKLKFTNLGPAGLGLGDRVVGRGPLLDAARTNEVGAAYLDCVVVRRITDGPGGPGGVYRCSSLLSLAEGDLVVEGLDPHGPGTSTAAVLGGTDAFAAAAGDATLTDTDDGTEFAIDLTT